MNFPAYVPVAVQEYITTLVDGGHGLEGWAAVANDPGHKWIASIVTFLRRFEKQDERIEEMFSYLERAELSDAHKKQFMNAAWASLADYNKARDAVKLAEKQRQAIATKATELADLLRGALGHGFSNVPMEFYSVRTLLHHTNGSDLTWPYNRRELLGLGDPMAKPNGEVDSTGAAKVVVNRVIEGSAPMQEPDSVTRLRGNIEYAWKLAPDLPDLLDTVAKAARNYEPQFYGRIGAALEKREGNTKTNYLRAFGHMLAEARIQPTTDVLNAVACMATVAINDENIVVTCDDVKQALEFKGKRKRKDTDPAG